MDKKVLDWLLQGPAWLKYAVELQLLDSQPDVTPAAGDPAVLKLVARLKSETAGLPAVKLGRVHYTESGKAYRDLYFLADIGFTVKDLGLQKEAESVFGFQSRDGSFVIPPNVKDNYLCMSAILISSLARMGFHDDPRVIKYIRQAMAQQMPHSGWDCYGESFNPEGSCPMADMNMLMLLGQYPDYRENPCLDSAISPLTAHWQAGDNRYGFGVGKRFRSLTYPAVKYGILRVLDALSLFPAALAAADFKNMLELVRAKARDGFYYAEGNDPAYSDFDFTQSAQPSRWITFLVSRIEKRVQANE